MRSGDHTDSAFAVKACRIVGNLRLLAADQLDGKEDHPIRRLRLSICRLRRTAPLRAAASNAAALSPPRRNSAPQRVRDACSDEQKDQKMLEPKRHRTAIFETNRRPSAAYSALSPEQ